MRPGLQLKCKDSWSSIARRFRRICLVSGSLLSVLTATSSQSPASLFNGPMQGSSQVGVGVLLVANPHLADPNFRRTVVLICQHGPEGSVGLILNRPTDVPLAKALPDIPALQDTVFRLYVGGPVQPTGILLLIRMDEQPVDTKQVTDHVYWGANVEMLAQVIKGGKPTETFRVYAGYAGWAPGQLESEMTAGAWATLPAETATIFTAHPEDLWSQLIETLKVPRILTRVGTPSHKPGWVP